MVDHPLHGTRMTMTVAWHGRTNRGKTVVVIESRVVDVWNRPVRSVRYGRLEMLSGWRHGVGTIVCGHGCNSGCLGEESYN